MSVHLELPNDRPRHYEGCNVKDHFNDSCTRVHGEFVDHLTRSIGPILRYWQNLEQRGEEEADEPSNDEDAHNDYGHPEFAGREYTPIEKEDGEFDQCNGRQVGKLHGKNNLSPSACCDCLYLEEIYLVEHGELFVGKLLHVNANTAYSSSCSSF